MQSFSLTLIWLLRRRFLNVFFSLENLAFRLPWPPIKISDLDKIHMVGRGLLQKHFSKTFVKISAVTISASSPLWLLRRRFLNIYFENLAFRLQWQPIKISDLDKILMVGRKLIQKHFCKTFFKISAVTQK